MKIEVINEDISTREGWEAYVKTRLEHMRTFAAAQDEVRFTEVSLVVTRDIETGAELERPGVIMIATVFAAPNDDAFQKVKDEFARDVQTISLAARAVGSIMFNEIWTAYRTPEQILAGARASTAKDRREAIVALVQHREFMPSTVVFTAMISRRGKNWPRTLAPWDQSAGFSDRFQFLLSEESEQAPDYEAMSELAREVIRDKKRSGWFDLHKIHRRHA